MWLGSSKLQIASICQIVYSVFILSTRPTSTLKSGREGNKRSDPFLNFRHFGRFWEDFSEDLFWGHFLYHLLVPGCYYQYQYYEEGEQIRTSEPCLNCTCHNQMLMCYLRVCPFIKPVGRNCVVEKRDDQCCPTIMCPEGNLSIIKIVFRCPIKAEQL